MQNYFSVSYRSPDHVSPVCLQCSRDCQACFNLYPLHSLLNTAASMNLLESQSDKVSALPQTPKVSYLRQNKSQNDLTMVYKALHELTHCFSLPPLLSSAPGFPFRSLNRPAHSCPWDCAYILPSDVLFAPHPCTLTTYKTQIASPH